MLKIQRLILKGPYDGHPRFLPFLSPGWGDAVKGGDEGGSVVGWRRGSLLRDIS